VTCITFLNNTFVVCGMEEGQVVVKNITDEDEDKRLSAHKKAVTAIQLCKANSILITSMVT